MARGLLSRLAAPDPSRPLDERQSVLGNIRTLLNTREGDSPAIPDFGILDFSDLLHNFPDAAQHVQQSIRNTIMKYEPRLSGVRIRPLPSYHPLKLAFEISAHGRDGKESATISIRTEIGPSGQAKIA
jgi:type VI secretion system protein